MLIVVLFLEAVVAFLIVFVCVAWIIGEASRITLDTHIEIVPGCRSLVWWYYVILRRHLSAARRLFWVVSTNLATLLHVWRKVATYLVLCML